MCIIIQYEGKEWSEGVSDCRCIADLKVNLMSKTGIPVRDQVLKCNGEVVQNGRHHDHLVSLARF